MEDGSFEYIQSIRWSISNAICGCWTNDDDGGGDEFSLLLTFSLPSSWSSPWQHDAKIELIIAAITPRSFPAANIAALISSLATLSAASHLANNVVRILFDFNTSWTPSVSPNLYALFIMVDKSEILPDCDDSSFLLLLWMLLRINSADKQCVDLRQHCRLSRWRAM